MAMKSPPPAPRSSLLRVEPTPKGLLLVGVALAVAWVALKLLPVVFVLVVAMFLVGTLGPAVEWLERKRWKRGWAIGVVFGSVLLFTLALMALTVPSLIEQVSSLVEKEAAVRGQAADWLGKSKITAQLGDAIRNVHYDELVKSSAATALEYSSRAAETMAYVASAVFLALYIMIDRDRLRGGMFALVPRTHHIELSRILLNLETIVGGYIRGQALTCAFMMVFTFVLLVACGVRNALAIALFAGIADVFPYIGVFLSVGPALAAAAARGPVIVTVVFVAMMAYEELESRYLVPKVYGNTLRLPSSVVLFSLLVGGTLMGIPGALIALPVAAGIRMLVEELRVALPGEDVDDSAVRAEDARDEAEYERRVDGVPAKKAAAIAVEIAEERIDAEKTEKSAESEKTKRDEDHAT